MAPLKDETGKRYNRLLVVSRADNHHTGLAAWLCKCDCGNEIVVTGRGLRRGDTQSCGCLRHSGRLAKGKSGVNEAFSQMRWQARYRGRAWLLSRDQVYALTSQPCYYCGAPPGQVSGYGHGKYVHNGIDRQDNGLGYTESNCVPCCKTCNRAKDVMSVFDFTTWIIKVYNYIHAKE